MLYKNLFVNWFLVISSFIIINYNLYNLICSFSLFNIAYLHNFFYYILYFYNIQIFDSVNYIYGSNINLLTTHWINLNYNSFLLLNETFSYILNIFYLLLNSITVSSTYCIYFDTKVIGSNSLVFYALQNKIFVVVGETTLCFFRIINNSDVNIYGIPIYVISPFEFSSFITKVQCFCFEEIFIFPYEIIELPVLFYINSKVSSLLFYNNNELTIEYIFFCNYTS